MTSGFIQTHDVKRCISTHKNLVAVVNFWTVIIPNMTLNGPTCNVTLFSSKEAIRQKD